jgi:4-hydroxybutyrate CoA-transferase
MSKTVSAQEAVSQIPSGSHILIHSVAAAPSHLIETLMLRAAELTDVHLYHMHTEGGAPYVQPEFENTFHLHSFFIGANVRKATIEGRADYIPVFLSEIPILIRKKIVPINVALISVSPPDKNGYVSLGTSVDTTLAAIEVADLVIAQVNRFMPRTFGDATVHIGDINYLVEYDNPLPTIQTEAPTPIEQKIGTFIAEIVPDGATLQMGIGSIPNAVLANLMNHQNLGIHTEMFSDGLLPLLEKGVVNNKMKKILRGRTVATFTMGTQKLYDFLDDNPGVLMKEVNFVNDHDIIAQNPKVVAINSAIEIDLTGQVCSDSIGMSMYSGVGGQIDFIRGAAKSEGGVPIIAMASRTSKGVSKLVPTLKEGAGVVSTRANVHYIITEYGVAFLYGKSLKDRAKALIQIAHPDDREKLEKAAFDRWKGHFF